MKIAEIANIIDPDEAAHYESSHLLADVFPLLKLSKNLDPSYMMDLDFLDCFGRGKGLEQGSLARLEQGSLAEVRHYFVEFLSVLHDYD